MVDRGRHVGPHAATDGSVAFTYDARGRIVTSTRTFAAKDGPLTLTAGSRTLLDLSHRYDAAGQLAETDDDLAAEGFSPGQT